MVLKIVDAALTNFQTNYTIREMVLMQMTPQDLALNLVFLMVHSVTRLGDFLDFGQLFKAFGSN